MNAQKPLTIESLEARDVPAIFGNPWVNADRLTMSFATEGVQYSNQTWWGAGFNNVLYSKMGSTMSQSVWQEELLRAFYTWTEQANINVGLVPDSGTNFGPQGMTSFNSPPADIRVGAIAQSSEVLATSIPYHPLTGYHAGNMMLNANRTFIKGNSPNTYDLYTVALHEAGNVLGLKDNQTEQDAALFGTYSEGKTRLKESDVNAVRALYGSRQADAFEGVLGNNTTANATTLSVQTDPAATTRKRVVADGSITSSSDVDVYKFTTPSGTSNIQIRLGTAGKSLLAGKVELLDSSGRVLASKTNTSPLQGDTTLSFSTAKANTTYFVRVTPGRTDTFAVGTYQLRVGFNYDPVMETKVNPVQQLGADTSTNETISTATTLTTTPGFTTNTQYLANATISSVDDVDYYKVTTPVLSQNNPMTITVQALQGLSASATVYTANGTKLYQNILLNWEGGLYRTQVPLTLSTSQSLYIKVQVQDPDWSSWSGNYQINVNFHQPLATRTTALAGVIRQNKSVEYQFEIQESQAYTFALSMLSTDTSKLSGFSVTFYDSTGMEVANLWTDGKGSTDTLTAFFKKGKYTARFFGDFVGSTSTVGGFSLSASCISDPIDVLDPTDDSDCYLAPKLITDDSPLLFYVGDPWSAPV